MLFVVLAKAVTEVAYELQTNGLGSTSSGMRDIGRLHIRLWG